MPQHNVVSDAKAKRLGLPSSNGKPAMSDIVKFHLAKKDYTKKESDTINFNLAKEDYTERGQFKDIATNLLRDDPERLKRMMIFLRKHGSPNIETGGKSSWFKMLNSADASVSATYNPFSETIDTGGSGKKLRYAVDREKQKWMSHTKGEDTIIAELSHFVQGREKTEGRPRFNLQTAKTLFSHATGGNPYKKGFGGFEDEAHNVIQPRLMQEYLKTVSTSPEYPSKPLSDWEMANQGFTEWGDMNPDRMEYIEEQIELRRQQRLVKEQEELDRLSDIYTKKEKLKDERSKAKAKKWHEDQWDRWIELGKPEGFWERWNK